MDQNKADPSKLNDNNLIWIDLEMTGLDTVNDEIIEIATIVTDQHLNELAVGPVIAIHQPQSRLDQMDDWNQKQVFDKINYITAPHLCMHTYKFELF